MFISRAPLRMHLKAWHRQDYASLASEARDDDPVRARQHRPQFRRMVQLVDERLLSDAGADEVDPLQAIRSHYGITERGINLFVEADVAIDECAIDAIAFGLSLAPCSSGSVMKSMLLPAPLATDLSASPKLAMNCLDTSALLMESLSR
jgi:hypothetical protein